MLKSVSHFSALLLALAPLADADVSGGLSTLPVDKIGLVMALIIAIIVIWKLNGKLANDKDGVQKDLIEFHKQRAEQAEKAGANYEKIVNANTAVIDRMTTAVGKQGELLTGVLHELQKKDR